MSRIIPTTEVNEVIGDDLKKRKDLFFKLKTYLLRRSPKASPKVMLSS